jgi:hypothetical protein
MVLASSINAEFGAVSGVVVLVVHIIGAGEGPGTTFVATQPAGNAGATTLSKFSEKIDGHGVGVTAGVAVDVAVAVPVAVGVPPAPMVIVKFASETSKKILPTPSTLIRAVVVGRLGIGRFSEPSLAVLAVITVENVVPPFVDNEILTFAALTGAAVVFATFHVIVCVLLPT